MKNDGMMATIEQYRFHLCEQNIVYQLDAKYPEIREKDTHT